MKWIKQAAVAALWVGAAAGVNAADLQVKSWAAACANCHGTNGKAVGSAPALAGQSASAMLEKMRQFKDGSRPATVMHQLAKGYTDEQIEQIVNYLAAQK